MIMSLKQKKVKFKPRIKFNHNMYIDYFAKTTDVNQDDNGQVKQLAKL